MKKLYPFLLLTVHSFIALSQTFTKVTDTANPIVTDPVPAGSNYWGCSWVDVDNDGWLDLFANRVGLYMNMGSGMFAKLIAPGIDTQRGFGNTWSDFDNDGDPDCFISGANGQGSFLFVNTGSGNFMRDTSQVVYDSLSLTGWGSAWADYNNDGFTDLVIAAPVGFAGITDKNKLLLNNGDGTFTRQDTSAVCSVTAPYTVPSWSDYDMDGDIDLFIGSGPANGTVAPDYLFENRLQQNGTAALVRITGNTIGNDPVDGQVWNWVDYDNDGDFDAFLTNYSGNVNGLPNNLYRNDGGTFTKLTAAEAGQIVSDADKSLASVWGDFDNDGDPDCFVTNDAGSPNRFYLNDGDGMFTRVDSLPMTTVAGPHFGATAGDYDRDGDLDLYVGGNIAGKGLYRNEQTGNNWMILRLQGVQSNRASIGARVSVKSVIGGNQVSQWREVSSQNSFNSMNALELHFGLGDALVADTVVLVWPSGTIDTCFGVAANQRYDVTEGGCPVLAGIREAETIVSALSVHPNPTTGEVTARWFQKTGAETRLEVCSLKGGLMSVPYERYMQKGMQEIRFRIGEAGVYMVSVISGGQRTGRQIKVVIY